MQSSLVDGQVSNDQKNSKALPLLKKISPVAWQNIHFHGRYTFCGSRHPINLDAMVANLTLEEGWTRATSIVDSIRLPKCHGKLPDGNFGGLGLQPLPLVEPGEDFMRFVDYNKVERQNGVE